MAYFQGRTVSFRECSFSPPLWIIQVWCQLSFQKAQPNAHQLTLNHWTLHFPRSKRFAVQSCFESKKVPLSKRCWSKPGGVAPYFAPYYGSVRGFGEVELQNIVPFHSHQLLVTWLNKKQAKTQPVESMIKSLWSFSDRQSLRFVLTKQHVASLSPSLPKELPKISQQKKARNTSDKKCEVKGTDASLTGHFRGLFSASSRYFWGAPYLGRICFSNLDRIQVEESIIFKPLASRPCVLVHNVWLW